MKIEDFDFKTRQINQFHAECIIINKESGARFGIIVNSNGIPPNEWIFNTFLSDSKLEKFFVDIDAEIVNNGVSNEKESLKDVNKVVDFQ